MVCQLDGPLSLAGRGKRAVVQNWERAVEDALAIFATPTFRSDLCCFLDDWSGCLSEAVAFLKSRPYSRRRAGHHGVDNVQFLGQSWSLAEFMGTRAWHWR